MTPLREALRRLLGLLAGCLLVYLPIAGHWSWAPVVLTVVLVALLAWYQAGLVTLPRTPLEDEAHRHWVTIMAEQAGAPLRAITVVEADAGAFTVPEALNRGGEVVFTRGDLAGNPLSHQLAQAARQLAVMQAPPRESLWGLLATGAGLGLITALHARLSPRPSAALVGVIGLLALAFAVVALATPRLERRGADIEDHARALLGALRDAHPEAFADLAVRQGLAEPGLIQLGERPPRLGPDGGGGTGDG